MRCNFVSVVTSNYGKENDGPLTSLNVKEGHSKLYFTEKEREMERERDYLCILEHETTKHFEA